MTEPMISISQAASTSTSSVTTTTKAIADIMLVLDVSGSMSDPISSEDVYDICCR